MPIDSPQIPKFRGVKLIMTYIQKVDTYLILAETKMRQRIGSPGMTN